MELVRFDPFRVDPFREMDRLHSEMNRLFEGLAAGDAPRGGNSNGGQNSGSALAPFAGRIWSPSVDVAESQTEVVLRAEIPGMKQNEIDIELNGDTLTVRGERKFEDEERKDTFVRVERSYGRFQRSFTLGVPVRQDDVRASYKDGILEIHLPKAESNRPRKVQVTGSEETAAPAPDVEPSAQPSDASANNTAQTVDAGENS